jgi:hypothetical protein
MRASAVLPEASVRLPPKDGAARLAPKDRQATATLSRKTGDRHSAYRRMVPRKPSGKMTLP